MKKITIIGAGSVGATIAYTLTVSGIVNEIVLIDINNDKALAEAMDIRQATPFFKHCSVYAGTYSDAKNSDIVIVTLGMARKPGQSRLDLAQANVNIAKSIIPDITRSAPDAKYIIVSNPVDILTYTFCKRSGLPENHIIGSGTLLDTARLRSKLSEIYSVNSDSIDACVLGEHGDSSFVPWSLSYISGIPAENYYKSVKDVEYPPINREEIEQYVRKSGGIIIKGKGATFYAVSASVCHICKCILGNIDCTLTVSSMLHGEYGIYDVCLSLVHKVGADGLNGKIMLPLNEQEAAALQKSAESLKEILKNTSI